MTVDWDSVKCGPLLYAPPTERPKPGLDITDSVLSPFKVSTIVTAWDDSAIIVSRPNRIDKARILEGLIMAVVSLSIPIATSGSTAKLLIGQSGTVLGADYCKGFRL